MSLKFNPFSGNFDFTGAGGGGGGGGGASYIDGEVATYADLPLDVSAALNSAWLVREASGVWPVSRKQAGIYIRTATGGSSRDADYTYAGTMPDVFSDAQFTLYGDVDSTKNVKFNVDAQVGTNQTRVITVPNKNITLDDAGDSRTPTSHTHGNLTNDGKIGTTANLPLKTGTNGVVEAGSFGTAAGSFCAGDDARLSDDRDPNLHAASHAAGGSDPVSLQLTQVVAPSGGLGPLGEGETLNDYFASAGNIVFSNTEDFAASGSITTSGLTQATARLIGRTSSGTGSIEEIQIGSGLSLSAGELSSTVSAGIPATIVDAKGDLLVASAADAVARLPVGGTNGHVLTVDSAETLGVKWAAASGGGVTGAASSASDVLGVSGANITGVDANADRLIFYDDSASKLTHATAGKGLSFDGTTLNSAQAFPVDPISRGATFISYLGHSFVGNSSNTVNTSGGFPLFSLVYVPKSANYTTFTCIVSSAGSASSLGKMALYTINAADALPNALVCESGTFAADSTGIKQPTMASTFVSEGWYYMAIGTNSTTNMNFTGDAMASLRGKFAGSSGSAPLLLDYSQKLYADLWPNPWNGTNSTFRSANHPITSLT
jgi:hypothetical protein